MFGVALEPTIKRNHAAPEIHSCFVPYDIMLREIVKQSLMTALDYTDQQGTD